MPDWNKTKGWPDGDLVSRRTIRKDGKTKTRPNRSAKIRARLFDNQKVADLISDAEYAMLATVSGSIDRLESYDAMRAVIKDLQNSLEAANIELKVATLKANSSLANNLCPDHRDKQHGKPCLACSLEAAKRDTERLVQVLIQFANASADFMEGEGEPQFSIYEDQMCWAIKALKDNGIDYDPMSGTRHAINTERKEKV